MSTPEHAPKFIQLLVPPSGVILALAEDGTVWINKSGDAWEQFPMDVKPWEGRRYTPPSPKVDLYH
jgi:hypothetical protein